MGNDLIDRLRTGLAAMADPARAPQMQAYMKSTMPYLGVGVPAVRRLTRASATEAPPHDGNELEAVVRELWACAHHREERYAAIALLDTTAARAVRSPWHLGLVRDLIVDGAWWDYVDELSHRVGDLLGEWPNDVRPEICGWAGAPDRWLRRSAIICQLGHKGHTDLDLLTQAIEHNRAHEDVFVRKAIGWALRDYARTDPDWVRAFVASHALSPLSRREALKHLAATAP